ncbi:UbiA family prenyltransferase [Vibrio chagasii]|nr:UbiA family prenyltransferase [Vibrio chagasii]
MGWGLAFIYPFMKRFTHLPQLFLVWRLAGRFHGMAAQTNELPSIVWFIFVINALWTIAWRHAHAMVDRDDDLKIGINRRRFYLAVLTN